MDRLRDRGRFPSLAARAVAGLAFAVVALASSAPAQTDRHVAPGGADVGDCSLPGNPCATISYARGQAAAGDTIKVQSGTYTDEITINKSLTIEGGYEAGFIRPMPVDPSTTILDGQMTHRPFAVTGPTTVATLDGFRVTNGNATTAAMQLRFGGGILVIADGTLTVRNCEVLGNVATTNAPVGFGGGICVLGGALTIRDSAVLGNTCKTGGSSNAFGGGIYVAGELGTGRAHLTIDNSTISNNTSTTSSTSGDAFGGGIFIGESEDTLISIANSTISGNLARGAAASAGSAAGGGLGAETTGRLTTLTIDNCTITNNVANAAVGTTSIQNADGGGIHLNAPAPGAGNDFSVQATITNSTISDNTAKFAAGDASGNGGGINARNSMLTITRTTISGNTATATPGNAQGGGIRLSGSPLTGDRLMILGNTARAAGVATTFQDGGGVSASGARANLILTNSFVADNTTSPTGGKGEQVFIDYDGGTGEVANLIQVTLAHSVGTTDTALFFEGAAGTTVNAGNLIIHNHGFGIRNADAGTFIVNNVLFDSVPTTIVGTTSGNLGLAVGSADFVPIAGDWHIGANSDAIDEGAVSGFPFDIDGQFRPTAGPAFDLGADEFGATNEPPTTPGIRPVLCVNVTGVATDPEMQVVSYLYTWASDGADAPVSQGPTTDRTASLFEGANGATFTEGETWQVTVTPRDEEGIEGAPAIGRFIIGADGEVTFLGFAAR